MRATLNGVVFSCIDTVIKDIVSSRMRRMSRLPTLDLFRRGLGVNDCIHRMRCTTIRYVPEKVDFTTIP